MPEVMMMKVLAIASTPITVVDCRMPMMLSWFMKASGRNAVNTRINATRLANASSFCLAWPPHRRAQREGGASVAATFDAGADVDVDGTELIGCFLRLQ